LGDTPGGAGFSLRGASAPPDRNAPQTDWQAFEQFTAREMTRRQCEFFNRVVALRNQ
jgi:hypothetical protein